MYNSLCYLCFLSCNLTIYPQNHFSFSIGVEQYGSQNISLTIIESQNLPNLQNLDVASQISHFESTLHNGTRKILIVYRSDTKKIDLVEYRRKGNQWKNIQYLQLQREEYDKLLDMLPSKNLVSLLTNAL